MTHDLITNMLIGIVLFWIMRRVISCLIDRRRHKLLKHLIVPLRHH